MSRPEVIVSKSATRTITRAKVRHQTVRSEHVGRYRIYARNSMGIVHDKTTREDLRGALATARQLVGGEISRRLMVVPEGDRALLNARFQTVLAAIEASFNPARSSVYFVLAYDGAATTVFIEEILE